MSSEKQKLVIKKFNNICGNVSDLCLKYSKQNTEMQIVHNMALQMIEDGSERLIYGFITEVYNNDSYKDNILSGNTKFFMDSDYEQVSNSKIIAGVKKCWGKMTKEEQDKIIGYFKKLIKYCDDYLEDM